MRIASRVNVQAGGFRVNHQCIAGSKLVVQAGDESLCRLHRVASDVCLNTTMFMTRALKCLDVSAASLPVRLTRCVSIEKVERRNP